MQEKYIVQPDYSYCLNINCNLIDYFLLPFWNMLQKCFQTCQGSSTSCSCSFVLSAPPSPFSLFLAQVYGRHHLHSVWEPQKSQRIGSHIAWQGIGLPLLLLVSCPPSQFCCQPELMECSLFFVCGWFEPCTVPPHGKCADQLSSTQWWTPLHCACTAHAWL